MTLCWMKKIKKTNKEPGYRKCDFLILCTKVTCYKSSIDQFLLLIKCLTYQNVTYIFKAFSIFYPMNQNLLSPIFFFYHHWIIKLDIIDTHIQEDANLFKKKNTTKQKLIPQRNLLISNGKINESYNTISLLVFKHYFI